VFEDIKKLHDVLSKWGIGVPKWPASSDNRATKFVVDLISCTKSSIWNLKEDTAEGLKYDLESLGLDVEINYLYHGDADLSVSLFSKKPNATKFIKKD